MGDRSAFSLVHGIHNREAISYLLCEPSTHNTATIYLVADDDLMPGSVWREDIANEELLTHCTAPFLSWQQSTQAAFQ